MLTCDACGHDTDDTKTYRMTGKTLCAPCRVAADGNPCADVPTIPWPQGMRVQPLSTQSEGVHPFTSAAINRDVNLPVMVTVLRATLDWPEEEVEALAAHLFEIATAKTEPSLRRKVMFGDMVLGELNMVDYMKLLTDLGNSVIPSSRHAVITDVS